MACPTIPRIIHPPPPHNNPIHLQGFASPSSKVVDPLNAGSGREFFGFIVSGLDLGFFHRFGLISV